MAVEHFAILAHAECAAQVFHAFLAVEPGLGRSEARAFQTAQDRHVSRTGEEIGEHVSLVELALALPRGVERDWNEKIRGLGCNSVVVHRLREPIAQCAAQVEVPVVFEAVDVFADDTAGQIRRDCGIEVQRATDAICAREGPAQRALERLRALVAKRGFYLSRAIAAGSTKVFPGAGRCSTAAAVGRVKHRNQRITGALEKSTDPHISTREKPRRRPG